MPTQERTDSALLPILAWAEAYAARLSLAKQLPLQAIIAVDMQSRPRRTSCWPYASAVFVITSIGNADVIHAMCITLSIWTDRFINTKVLVWAPGVFGEQHWQ